MFIPLADNNMVSTNIIVDAGLPPAFPVTKLRSIKLAGSKPARSAKQISMSDGFHVEEGGILQIENK